MYAILDIETTGGKFNEEGITEIAIYKFDGHAVIDQFISLVNPEREIQPFVVNLTGINSKMLRTAPKFYEVAKRIVEITEDCIIVAHNSEFDYRILRTEFSRLGFEFKRKTLCTVALAQEIMPEQESYSLGKLTSALGIPVGDRHRASGDAIATVKLFKMLLAKDLNKHIIQDAVKAEPKYEMATNLKSIIADLPSRTGVFYFHNTYGKIIYIDKGKNIRNRVNQHFTSTNPKSIKMQKQVAAVTYEVTGNELIAFLKEHAEIKLNKPSFNRTRRKPIFTHALYQFTDENGYINLKIENADGRKKAITTFSNYQSGKQFLIKAIEKDKLCPKLVGLDPSKTTCFKYHIHECNGACANIESPTDYNLRIEELILRSNYKDKNLLIIDKGRTLDERSVILIENGVFKGLGYYDLNFQITNKTVLDSIITPMENNKEVEHIIQNYLRKNKQVKIIELNK
ncbi:exonuclease domain-containing protein [Gelidibacter maritimus]|uniref:Exonuclease n=1 Tax=Gelidibacter maritimus TaxID=2761487 RepID=A0A7W2R229_9FLAO|nr:exonuclease domain-containing protein [Gelidibacter maritimus]MBA6151153.1 exonuclease [Gelidibacter maritimus]